MAGPAYYECANGDREPAMCVSVRWTLLGDRHRAAAG